MDTLEALLQLVPLDHLPRTGWILAGVAAPESIAGHAHGMALLALALAPRVDPPLDADRAASLALVHDAPEAWLGDVPRPGARFLPPGAKRAAEDAIAAELFAPLSQLARARYDEYEAAATREARFARLCDGLQLGVRLVAYHRAGARGLSELRATVAALDCTEFAPCEELQRAILGALGVAPS